MLDEMTLTKMLQNVPHFWNTKTQVVFFSFFISFNLIFPLMNALVYVNIDQGIHKEKTKVARNEKFKKLLGHFIMHILLISEE